MAPVTYAQFEKEIEEAKKAGLCAAVFIDLRDDESHMCRLQAEHTGEPHACHCNNATEWWEV